MRSPHIRPDGVHRFTQDYHCSQCGELLETIKGKRLVDYVLSDWHHWGTTYFKGIRDTDSKGKTLKTFSAPTRQGLTKIGIQTNFYFCSPCFLNIFKSNISIEECNACNKEIDESLDHSLGTIGFKKINGVMSLKTLKYHHECLPDLFKDLKSYVLERKRELLW